MQYMMEGIFTLASQPKGMEAAVMNKQMYPKFTYLYRLYMPNLSFMLYALRVKMLHDYCNLNYIFCSILGFI